MSVLLGPDDLVVRFVSGNGSGSGTDSNEGLEILRCTGEGNGKVGIGDEFGITTGLRPQRRLHVHDPGTSNITNAQLRLCQKFNLTFTDFRTTTNGNLYLNMTGNQQRVGIEEENPLEVLDVKGNGRFQNIPSTAANCVILGETVTVGTAADNRLKRLDFNGNSNSYLAGNGTWQSFLLSACEWNVTSGDLTMGYIGACNLGKVGIGLSTPDAKLTVLHLGTGTTERGVRVNSSGGTVLNYGIDVISSGPDIVYGVAAEAVGIGKTFGGQFTATASSSGGIPEAIGCLGRATNNVGSATQTGVLGNAAFGKYNTGVKGAALGSATSITSIGVYGEATGSGALWAMWSQGSSYISGGTWQSSDAMLKENISPINNALEIITQLEPKSYTFRTEEFPQLNLPSEIQYGVVAQELESILPNLVRDCISPEKRDSVGNIIAESVSFKAVNYVELIPILLQALKDQQQQINSMQNQLTACCNASENTRNKPVDDSTLEQDVVLRSIESIILNQNVPNPFAEQTTIQYSIDTDFNRAQILFYDTNGKLIQTSDIKSKGAGQINVFADDLTSGIYSYVLVVDGKVVDTKKMIRK